ncbi:MAG: (d)CMP kinase [Actinomycetota bacterium]|nr:(d)CMP kinase [Actinomycetota bacterium]
MDSGRAASPTTAAPDAVRLDSSALDAQQVVDLVLELVADAGLTRRQ